MWALNGTQGRAHKEACGEEHVWHCAPYLLGKSKQMRLAGSCLLVFMVCVCVEGWLRNREGAEGCKPLGLFTRKGCGHQA